MIHTECKYCELSNGDCGNHFEMDGAINYDIASLSACDRYGNCMFFKSKGKRRKIIIDISDEEYNIIKEKDWGLAIVSSEIRDAIVNGVVLDDGISDWLDNVGSPQTAVNDIYEAYIGKEK